MPDFAPCALSASSKNQQLTWNQRQVRFRLRHLSAISNLVAHTHHARNRQTCDLAHEMYFEFRRQPRNCVGQHSEKNRTGTTVLPVRNYKCEYSELCIADHRRMWLLCSGTDASYPRDVSAVLAQPRETVKWP